MNVTGGKVHIRDRLITDCVKETIWAQDPRVTALDVAAGKVFNRKMFSIDTLEGIHIGSCSLYNWNSESVQLGIRIGDRDYWGKEYGTEVVSILVNYWLMSTTLDCIWLKVLPSNTRAIKCYEKCGFVHSGRLALNGYEFITMEIVRDREP